MAIKLFQPADKVIAIRPGRRLPIFLFSIAGVFLFLGLLKFMPFIHDREPRVGFAVLAVAATTGITGCLKIRDRHPRVYLTKDELQLPGWGIERIPWRDIVQAEAYVHHDGAYLGIDLRAAARGRVGPPFYSRGGDLYGCITGRRHDLWLVYWEALEWSAERLADEINERRGE